MMLGRALRLTMAGAVFAMVALCTAQLGSESQTATPAAGTPVESNQGPITIKVGDVIQLPNGQTITVGPSTTIPAGTRAKFVSGEHNGAAFVMPPSRGYISLAVYPLGYFSISGPIQQPDRGFKGGTKTVGGVIFSAAAGKPFNNGNQSLEIGGFYFRNYQGHADLYQIYLRGMFAKELGVQAGFLDSTRNPLRSWAFYLVYDLNSARLNPGLKRHWDLMFGGGALVDAGASLKSSTDSTGATTDNFYDRSSVNLSAWMDASLEIAHNTSVLFSYWYIRDRNVDINRFALGVGYKF